MSSLEFEDIREKIVNAGRRLKEAGLVASTDGNLSIRIGDTVFITPSGFDKGNLKDKDIVETRVNISSIDGIFPKPSMEFFMHSFIYKKRDDINAIVHTHSPFSTVFAVKGDLPDYSLLMETKILPEAGISGIHDPGSIDLAEEVAELSEKYDIILLKKHGVISLGKSIEKAIENIERFEFLCKINVYSNLF